MRVCITVEGAYPYITGGVSSWLQRLILEFEEIEFIIQTIIVDRKQTREMKYRLPKNVIEVHEVYLFDDDYMFDEKNIRLSKNEYCAFESLFFGIDIKWIELFEFFKDKKISLNSLLGSKDFLELTKEYYIENYSDVVFTDFLWSMRSMYQPLFNILRTPHIKADLYHTLSTGYSGVIASMQKLRENKPLLLTEHGIYTREREEEIIKANWVRGIYKDLWINQFYKLSSCSYLFADEVTALFKKAAEIQVELGCKREKINVIGNGVDIEKFESLEESDKKDTYINIGAVLRVTPIKDVKTMINSFFLAKQKDNRLKLWIMGPIDENSDYVEECMELISQLNIEDIVFTGSVDVTDYMGKMDFLILSSLSEGQPLVILEGFAAKKPFVATNVGDCKSLIYGNDDGIGDAGIVVPLMNTEKMSKAIVTLSENEELRHEMGLNGHRRVEQFHKNSDIFKQYMKLYNKLINEYGEVELWQE